jgi:hypothetical protein
VEYELPSPREIARLLGGDLHGDRILCPGPGHSRHDRSLSVWIKPDASDGFRTHSFAGDDLIVCKDHVRTVLGLSFDRRHHPGKPLAQRVVASQAKDDRDEAEPQVIPVSIWRRSRDPRNTPVERYLKSRGLTLDIGLTRTIRFDPLAGSMVTLFRDIHTDEPCGIHRTFLDRDGQKLGRKMLGRAKGAAIKLDPDEDVTLGLHIGEGIETCLTGRQEGFRPVWALGSKDPIADFPVLAGIEALGIHAEHADNDGKGSNEHAINKCARRYVEAGCEVWIIDPPHGDLNELIRRKPLCA